MGETLSFREGRRRAFRGHGKEKTERRESPREAMAGETLKEAGTKSDLVM